MRRLFVLAVGVFIACAAVNSCGGNSDTEPMTSSNWLTFEGDGISVKLPDSFKGGNPADPVVFALLAETISNLPSGDAKEAYQGMLDTIQGDLETGFDTATKLLALGQPNTEGWMPTVQVWPMPRSPGQSLKEFVESWCGRLEDATIESLTGDWARIVSRIEGYAPEDPEKWTLQHVVFVERPELAGFGRVVFYTFDDPYSTALDEVFRTSAETIRVGADGHSGKGPRSGARTPGLAFR